MSAPTLILKGKSRDIFSLPPDHTIAEAVRTLAEKLVSAPCSPITAKDGSLARHPFRNAMWFGPMAQDGAAALDHPVSRVI